MELDTGARRAWQYQYNEHSQLVFIDGPRADVNDTTALCVNLIPNSSSLG